MTLCDPSLTGMVVSQRMKGERQGFDSPYLHANEKKPIVNDEFWHDIKFEKPITAYRLWRREHDGAFIGPQTLNDNYNLFSLNGYGLGGQHKWDKGLFEGTCDRLKCVSKIHTVPFPRCTCGIYSYRTLNDLMTDLPSAGNLTTYAVGTVEIGGRVMPCEYGWKSQYAILTGIINLSAFPDSECPSINLRIIDAVAVRSLINEQKIRYKIEYLDHQWWEYDDDLDKVAEHYDVPYLTLSDDIMQEAVEARFAFREKKIRIRTTYDARMVKDLLDD